MAFIFLFLIAPLAAMPFVLRRTPAGIERVLAILALPAIGFTVWVASFGIVDAAISDWAGAKLAPIVAMVHGQPHGYELYQDPESGVMNGWIYGPIPALILLPATIWSTPTPALISGTFLNFLCTIVPVIWIHLLIVKRASLESTQPNYPWPVLLAGICLFILLIPSHKSLRMVIYNIGPDGQALGLAACSVAILMTRPASNTRLAMAATFAMLAVWSKQTVLPLLAAAPIYLWMFDGWRITARYLLMLFGVGILISTGLILAFGPSNMWFNMVTLVSADPWQRQAQHLSWSTQIAGWWKSFGQLLVESAQYGCLLLGLLITAKILAPDAWKLRRFREWPAAEYLVPPLLCAVLSIPAATLGNSIVGGNVNHLALTTYFLAISATGALILAAIRFPQEEARALTRCGLLGVIVFKACAFAIAPGQFEKMVARLSHPRDNAHEKIYQFVMEHPGTTYFPWNPLPSVLAEGKLYHFEWGVIDRSLAGITIMSDQLRSHFPDHISLVAFTPDAKSRYVLQCFPQSRQISEVPGLPGFAVYAISPGVTISEKSPQDMIARDNK